MTQVYLDNNATTELLPAVAEAMREYRAAGNANPASQHGPGRRARQTLERAREEIAALLGADAASFAPDQAIFTSGGTEANNLALLGVCSGPPAHLIISAIEHPSITGTAEHLKSVGWRVDRLAVDQNGVVRIDQLAELLCPDTRLVSIMLGNNETGVLQPVREAAQICQARGVPLHTDATQVVGKLPVNLQQLGAAAITCTAHKFHGPQGIGLLLARHELRLTPQLWGGFQQGGIRPGTESVELAVGMLAALRQWQPPYADRAAQLTALRSTFEDALRAGRPDIEIHGASAARLPHTSCVSFPPFDRQMLLLALDQAGIACSTGSACASGSSDPSPVLLAMGLAPGLVSSALRFSFGLLNTPAESTEAAARILNVCNDLEGRKTGRNLAAAPPATPGKGL